MAGRRALLRRRLLGSSLEQSFGDWFFGAPQGTPLSNAFFGTTPGENNIPSNWADQFFGIQQLPQPTATGALPATGATTSSWADLLYNAATGNVSPDQAKQLAQQADQENVQAGGTPDIAASQALINTALENSGPLPGAFGITWTGAAPGGTNWVTQAAANAANALGASSGAWVWWALGGVGALWLLMRSK